MHSMGASKSEWQNESYSYPTCTRYWYSLGTCEYLLICICSPIYKYMFVVRQKIRFFILLMILKLFQLYCISFFYFHLYKKFYLYFIVYIFVKCSTYLHFLSFSHVYVKLLLHTCIFVFWKTKYPVPILILDTNSVPQWRSCV